VVLVRLARIQAHMYTTTCKLPEEAGGGYCILWVEWNSCSFRILILGNGSAWNGHVRLFTNCTFNLKASMKIRE
jgi:hypothetical protein